MHCSLDCIFILLFLIIQNTLVCIGDVQLFIYFSLTYSSIDKLLLTDAGWVATKLIADPH